MPEELSRNRFNVILQHDWSIEQRFLHIRVFTHVAFSLTWPASMLIEKKENVYITKEYNSQSIFLLDQHGRRSIALMHVYVTQANFTTKPRFEIKNKRSFTEMNSQGSRVEKNTHAQKVQMQKILFTNEACW